MNKKNSLIKEEKAKLKSKKIPKDVSQTILKKIFKNLLKAIGVIIYFAILNLAYVNIKQERLVGDIQVFAGVFLIIRINNARKSIQKR